MTVTNEEHEQALMEWRRYRAALVEIVEGNTKTYSHVVYVARNVLYPDGVE